MDCVFHLIAMTVCDIEEIMLPPVWPLKNEIDLAEDNETIEEIKMKVLAIEKESFKSTKKLKKVMNRSPHTPEEKDVSVIVSKLTSFQKELTLSHDKLTNASWLRKGNLIQSMVLKIKKLHNKCNSIFEDIEVFEIKFP